MFLIEPFVWMFSVKNFKHHFLYLLLTAAVCWVISVLIFVCTGGNFFITPNLMFNILIIILEVSLILAPVLCLTGYFWCLTDNIINRDTQPELNSVYDGKSANLKNIIELPEWNILKFAWRGIASIVATILMYIPFALVMSYIVFNLSNITAFWNFNNTQAIIVTLIIVILISLLIPGLLWNYARRDSVFAMLNFPKSIYIMESYPKKYFLNSFLIVLFSFARSFVTRAILFSLGYGAMLTTNSVPASYSDLLLSGFITVYIIIFIISYIIDCYWIFVNSYLLGTIAPPSEY